MRLIVSVTVLVAVSLLLGCVTESTSRKRDRADDETLVESQISLGVGYMRNRNYDRARKNFQSALEIDSRSARAHNYLGLLSQLEGDIESARDHFEKAVRYNSDYTAARNNYGAFLYEIENYDKAIEQLQLAARDRTYPNRPQVYENLGIVYLTLNDQEKARQAFQTAVELNPEQPRALLELATMEFEARNYDRARKFYSSFKQVARQNARSLWLGIRLARVFNNEDEEASLSMALKNIYPDSPQYEAYRKSVFE